MTLPPLANNLYLACIAKANSNLERAVKQVAGRAVSDITVCRLVHEMVVAQTDFYFLREHPSVVGEDPAPYS